MAVFLAKPLRAESQVLTESLTGRHQLRRAGKGFGRAELELEPAGGLAVDGAHLVELHGRGNRGAEADGIHTVLVADEVNVGHRIEVADTGVGAHGPRGLVLEAARVAPVLGLVLHREVALVDGGDASARNRAAKAGGVGGEVGLAVALSRLVHRLAGNLAGVLELNVARVAGRQCADLVDDVHQHLRPVGRQALAGDGVVGKHLLLLGCRLHKARRVLDVADAAGAADGHRLEILRGHHGAHARAARRAVQIVDDAGIQAARLRGAADRGNSQQRVLMFLVDQLVYCPDGFPPQVVRRQQLGVLVLHVQINGRRRFALEYDHVPSGVFHLGADEAARVRAGDGAGQRTLGDHRITPARGGCGSGQRSGCHDQLVFASKGIALGIDLLDQVSRRQPSLPQILLRPLHVERLGGDFPLAEIDAQNFLSPSHDVSSEFYALARLPLSVFSAQARIRSRPVAPASI